MSLRKIILILGILSIIAILVTFFYTLKECEHKWSNYFTDTQPTYEKEGVEKRVCELCGEAETRKIAKLAHAGEHNYTSWGSDEERHWLECGDEGCDVKTNSTVHTWKSYEDGERCQICSRPKD